MSSDEDVPMDEPVQTSTLKFKGKGKAVNGDPYLHTQDENLPWYAPLEPAAPCLSDAFIG